VAFGELAAQDIGQRGEGGDVADEDFQAEDDERRKDESDGAGGEGPAEGLFGGRFHGGSLTSGRSGRALIILAGILMEAMFGQLGAVGDYRRSDGSRGEMDADGAEYAEYREVEGNRRAQRERRGWETANYANHANGGGLG